MLILLIMICVIPQRYVIIVIIQNNLIIIMLIVVRSIFVFVIYYMGDDVSNGNFKLVILLFLSLIVFILSTGGVLIFLGWEGIRIMSILLIGYWIRPSGKSGAIAAIMYNRIGDLVFLVVIYQIIGELMVILLVVAILCKSSLYLWGYWLPVAMERPTPVSSLLHSSTIVVAGVYLIILYSVNINVILVVVILLSLNIIRHYDVKKNIAYSTSIHLLLILILRVMRIYHAVVIYIILHRIVKGQIFQVSRYGIHSVGGQDIRRYVINRMTYIMLIGIILLSSIVGIVIMGSKELVVLNMLGLLMIVLVFTSYIYTLMYINKKEIIGYVGEIEGWYVICLIVCSIRTVIVNFSIWMGIVLLGLALVIWMRNPMSTLL